MFLNLLQFTGRTVCLVQVCLSGLKDSVKKRKKMEEDERPWPSISKTEENAIKN